MEPLPGSRTAYAGPAPQYPQWKVASALDLTHPATYVEVHPDPDFGPTEEYIEALPTGV